MFQVSKGAPCLGCANRTFEFLVIPFFLIFFSCSKNQESLKTIEKVNRERQIIQNLTSLDLMEEARTLSFQIPLILPLPLLSGDSSIVIYDFADKQLKQFGFNGESNSFHPLREGPSKLEGVFFKGVGYSNESSDSLIVSSNSNVKAYNIQSNYFSERSLDEFETCPSFNSSFYEIFRINHEDHQFLITQQGDPCYDLEDLFNSVSEDNFKNKHYVRIKDITTGQINYSLQLPDLNLKNLYERFNLILTYNEERDSFFAMLNPLTFLFEYKFYPETMEFELVDYWDIDLRYSDLPIDYFIEPTLDQNKSKLSLDYNFELNFIDTFDDFLFISYQPSKDLMFSDLTDAPYSSHNLLAIVDIEDKKVNTFALEYDEVHFSGASNNLLWFYDVVSSEAGGESIFRIFERDRFNQIYLESSK